MADFSCIEREATLPQIARLLAWEQGTVPPRLRGEPTHRYRLRLVEIVARIRRATA